MNAKMNLIDADKVIDSIGASGAVIMAMNELIGNVSPESLPDEAVPFVAEMIATIIAMKDTNKDLLLYLAECNVDIAVESIALAKEMGLITDDDLK